MQINLQERDRLLCEAEILSQKLLLQEPGNPDLLNCHGLILMEQNRFAEAADCFCKAFGSDDRGDIGDNLVRAISGSTKTLVNLGEYSQAEIIVRKAIDRVPRNMDLMYYLAFILCKSSNYKKALEVSEMVLDVEITNARAFDIKGLALTGLGRLEEALEEFDKAIALDSNLASAFVNKGIALNDLGRFDSAIMILEKVIKHDPTNAHALNTLGLSHANKANYFEAEAKLRKAIYWEPEFPEAHFNLSRILLMLGKYEEGWQENEWRWRCPSFPSTKREFEFPLWNGEELAGKTILVWSEQGIGDEIMFANTIPDLIDDGAKVLIECQSRLVPIFSASFTDATVFARSEPPSKVISKQSIDFQIPMGSLCNHYRKSRDSFPVVSTGYLKVREKTKHIMAERYGRLGTRPLVGICWKSGNPLVGVERSVKLELLETILANTKCRFVSLQYGDVGDELAALYKRHKIKVYKDKNVNPHNNLEDWFAQIATMDLVISVDNSTIQVSGSQGISTWVLVNFIPEWRFGLEGSGHDWHSSVKVYRQSDIGDWEGVIKHVKLDFDIWVSKFK